MKKNSKGFTLPELLVTIAIGGFMSLAVASVFIFSIQQFNALIDQNEGEEALLLSSYYIRAILAQAVKTSAVANQTAIAAVVASNAGTPVGVSAGAIDQGRTCTSANCIAVSEPWARTPVASTTFAVFTRENGGDSSGNPSSVYLPTGIFYRPSQGTTSGRLYFSQAAGSGGAISDTDDQIWFDRVVAFGIAQNGIVLSELGTGAVKEINIYIRVRYFKGSSSVKNYDPDPAVAQAAGSIFTDIEQVINVGLRNNILGSSVTGDATVNERLNGGIYFYKFTAPPVM